jgi:RNA polymerase sigma-70 factor (ECF subfamily)
VDFVEFAAFLAERAQPAPTMSAVLDGLHAADLLLVFGCQRQNQPAIDAFQRLLIAEVRRAGRRLASSESATDEVTQGLVASMLVGDAGAPGLSRYTGRGSLVGFVRVAASRTLLRLIIDDRRTGPLPHEEVADAAGELRDPEVELLKFRYREDFNDAFRHALGALTKRERAVLRLHLVGGLNIDSIGTCYHVHRSTVARWMADTRAKLLDETQRVLIERLGIENSEVQSLGRLLQSQLDPGMTTILRNFKQ